MNTSSYHIGASGHQYLGDQETADFVAQQFRQFLKTSQQREQQVVFHSALAKGADQLFVRIALEEDVPVEVVLPCAEYETIFSSDAERNEYARLLHACQTYHQLPFQECSEEAFLAAGQWLVDHCDVMILAWNGLPPLGRGGTGDVASYARFLGCPFIHLNTQTHSTKTYGDISSRKKVSHSITPKKDFAVAKEQVYQGKTLTVNQYRLAMPDGKEVTRDVVERPESVLVLPVGQKDIVLLVEEYDFAAGVWQLTLPGGKVEQASLEKIEEQAQKELRQETGYRANRLEKLVDFYNHPGYISHNVHAFLAQDLEWDPLEIEAHEEIQVKAYTLQEALDATLEDYRCDPEAALVLWLYAQKRK